MLIIIGMLVTGFADILPPASFSLLSVMGYAFPMFLLLNFGMVIVWMVVRKMMLVIPVLGFIICYVPVMKYCPMNMGKDAPEGCLKVMTYNTWQYGGDNEAESDIPPVERRNAMLHHIAESDCDIVCLQESPFYESILADIDSIVKPVMPYRDNCAGNGGNTVAILSKYPVKRHEKIDYPSAGNLSAAFYLDVDGKEVIVVVNHLETNHFSVEEKKQFGTMVKGGMDRKGIKEESKFVLRKLADAAVKRQPQAEAIASFVRMHQDRPLIVTGDFNDIPISYVRRTIAKDLTDAYVSTATGPGFTYHKNGMYVRIDNIFCSSHFTPYECHVDKTIEISDHFPLVSYLKFN